jgi:hypothetical protein
MGGLGPNIGGEQWEEAKRKKEIALQYANNLKQLNTSHALPLNVRLRSGHSNFKEKEASTRERMNEFSKNIPKPKVRKASYISHDSEAGIRQARSIQPRVEYGQEE